MHALFGSNYRTNNDSYIVGVCVPPMNTRR
jgi:hypothetical protein